MWESNLSAMKWRAIPGASIEELVGMITPTAMHKCSVTEVHVVRRVGIFGSPGKATVASR